MHSDSSEPTTARTAASVNSCTSKTHARWWTMTFLSESLLLSFLLLAPQAAGFSFATLQQLSLSHAHSISLRSRIPTLRPHIHSGIRSARSMDVIPIFYEGFDQGYAMFEFIGRRLPKAFFKELGTPERSPVWMSFFLLSNIAFPIAGVKILTKREKTNKKLAVFVFIVGAVSTAFHWTQCSLGSGSPVTHTW